MNVGTIDAISDGHSANVIVEMPRTSASVAVACAYWANDGVVPTQHRRSTRLLFDDVGTGFGKITNSSLSRTKSFGPEELFALIERGDQRLMSKSKTAHYCGCESFSTLNNWIQRGIIPGPIPGTQRFDRKALDLSLDKASGLQNPTSADPLGEWQVNRARSAKRNS
jgi:hypothetical protein